MRVLLKKYTNINYKHIITKLHSINYTKLNVMKHFITHRYILLNTATIEQEKKKATSDAHKRRKMERNLCVCVWGQTFCKKSTLRRESSVYKSTVMCVFKRRLRALLWYYIPCRACLYIRIKWQFILIIWWDLHCNRKFFYPRTIIRYF